MAIIIRNGIEYAGGGSGGIEITQADYNALGDKVKTDGVTYFIIDPDEEQSFAENCKVRYINDPMSVDGDFLQALDADGNWVNAIRLGLMKAYYYNKEGSPYNDSWSNALHDGFAASDTNDGGDPTRTSSTDKCSKPWDVSNFSKLFVNNCNLTMTGVYSYNTTIQILGGSAVGASDYFSVTLCTERGTWSGSKEIDISSIKGDLYITIAMSVLSGSSGNSATATFTVDSIYASN